MKTEKKTHSIQLRVTEDEKDRISRKSEDAGLPISAYLLDAALGHDASGHRPQCDFATAVCRLNLLLDECENSPTREAVREWGASVWQFLK